jgi:CheY-like chemotaxis protein
MSYLNATPINSAHNKKFPGGNRSYQVPNIESSLAGTCCLVLDDEFLIALDIQQILESAGVSTVTCVGSTAEALEKLRGGAKFDFAVLDVKLRGATRDSVAVATELTRQKTPFVFLTGMHRQDERVRQFPNAPVVEKPYEASLLLDAILRALADNS